MYQSAVDRIRILHVDDKPDFAALVATLLEREDDRFTVQTATSATEGLAQLADTEFDCVISDYGMPGMDGIEFLETVRTDFPDLPFILFTGKGSEQVAGEAISAGVTDYLQKEGGTDQYTILANRVQNYVEQIRTQRQRQRQLDAIETAQEGISILDENGHFIYVNEAYAKLYGYNPEEMLGEHWELIYRDEDTNDIYEEVLPTVEETGHWHGITTGLRADGSTFREDHVLATTVHGELVCTVQDITDREDLQEKYELIARASTDAFWEWEPDSDGITRSEEYLTQFGYDKSDVRNDTDWWREHIHPDDRERVLTALERAVAEPESTYDETYRFRRKDGTYGFIRSRGYVVYDENGRPQRMVGAHIDITDRKEGERMIEELHTTARQVLQAETKERVAEIAVETLRDTLDMPLNATWFHDENENLLRPAEWTQRAEEAIGDVPTFRAGEGLAWDAFEMGESRHFADVSTVPGRFNRDTVVKSEIILPIGSHGVIVAASTDSGSFTEMDVSLAETVASHTETALDRLEHEADLRQQNDRLEEFAGVVSHDLQNPLQVLSTSLELAEETGSPDDFDRCHRAINDMEQLIEDLLALAQQGDTITDTQQVDFGTLCENCWRNIETEDATLNVDTDQVIMADRGRLKQLIENLVRNAVEHGGDDVTVTVGVLEGSTGFYIADTGPGIPEEEREEIFTSGYSTSASGTGFGLSIVREIAGAHAWDISVTESTDGGARFQITGVEFVQ